MKKTYFEPQLEVLAEDSIQLLTQSVLGINKDSQIESSDGFGGREYDFEDEEE